MLSSHATDRAYYTSPGQCWVSYFLKVTSYSYKLLHEKVTCYTYMLHFKSNKLLYMLLCRYFITSLKLQGL